MDRCADACLVSVAVTVVVHQYVLFVFVVVVVVHLSVCVCVYVCMYLYYVCVCVFVCLCVCVCLRLSVGMGVGAVVSRTLRAWSTWMLRLWIEPLHLAVRCKYYTRSNIRLQFGSFVPHSRRALAASWAPTYTSPRPSRKGWRRTTMTLKVHRAARCFCGCFERCGSVVFVEGVVHFLSD
jgi:hypothetical protein